MAGAITWEELRELASVEVARGRAISLYLNLDPSHAATAGDVETRLNSLLDTAGKLESQLERELSHDERMALREDFEQIRRWFAQDFVRDGTRGIAVFCGSLAGIWRTRPLPEPVSDDVALDMRLAVAPLAALVGRGDGALVVVAAREQGRFLRLREGQLEEVADLTEGVPGRHDQGGWAQARFQRHIDELAAEHLRAVADELDRRVRDTAGDLDVVIVAPEESRAELATHLTQPVEQALAGWIHADAHATDAELLDDVQPLLEGRRATREAALLDRWSEGVAGGRGTSGWDETLEAINESRVEILLLAAGVESEARRCPSCGWLAATTETCPLDGTATERTERGVDAAVGETLRRGGTIWIVTGPELAPAGGAGALLRF
jgi:peptide chain release factor subunit 1